MSKFRLGLSKGFLAHVSADSEELSDTIEKAGQGFSRGPKAGHKYWRRIRTIHNGKLGWDYYYNTPKDRQNYLEDQARRIKNKKAKIKNLEKRHKNKSEFKSAFKELKVQREDLRDLSEDYVATLLGWDKPPDITLSPTAREVFEDGIREYYASTEEPDDLHGQQITPLRALEMAMKRLPAVIRQHWSGSIKGITVASADEDSYLRSSGAGGYCRALPDGTSEIVINTNFGFSGSGKDKGLSNWDAKTKKVLCDGALGPVHVAIHEIAHAVHNQMGAVGPMRLRDYDGPNWADWESFSREHLSKNKKDKIGKKGGEQGVTTYAEENTKERWAESFTAALMYPWTLAATSPKTYDWFRNFFGDDVMMPRESDPALIAELQEKLESAASTGEREMLRRKLDMSTGIMDIADPENDPRLQWWLDSAPSKIQRLMQTQPHLDAAGEVYSKDPPDWDSIGAVGDGNHDRFFEMNYRSRSVHFRMGPKAPNEDYSGWEPAREGGKQRQPTADEIKEVFDEKGNKIDPRFAYFHLIQDVISDDQVIGIVKHKGAEVEVTAGYLHEHGFDTSDPLISGVVNKREFRMILRSFGRPKLDADMRKLRDSYTALATATGKDREKLQKVIDRLEKLLDHTDWATTITSGKGGMPLPATMMPHEVTGRHHRLHSGTFAYDRFEMVGQDILDKIKNAKVGSAQHAALIEDFRAKQSGVRLENRRWPKGSQIKDPTTGKMVNVGGRFRRGVVVVDGDGIPILDAVKYTNENPDGTSTVIKTKRDGSGSFRIDNPMWSRLLTPNGEEVTSAAHLEEYSRVAARAKRTTWMSVKTDRRRYKDSKGRWKVDKAGDTGHHYHMEVQFDGSGQPKILGKEWKRRLGQETPRVDHMLEKDTMFKDIRNVDRSIIPAEQVRMRPPPKRKAGQLPRHLERVIITVEPEEQVAASAKRKDVVARLSRVIMGKKAGEPPAEPGWDRMPEGFDPLVQDIPAAPAGKVSPHERKLIASGVLPPWYNGSKPQKKWYHDHYKPAKAKWKTTFEAEKSKAYETVYEFIGEVGGGAPGRSFRRSGDKAVLSSTRQPISSASPDALEKDLLGYLHEEVDPRSGATVSREMRLKLPRDGRITEGVLSTVDGVSAVPNKLTGVVDYIRCDLDTFHKLRKAVGGLSLTDGADRLLKDRADMLVAAEKATQDSTHSIELEQIDPARLADEWGAGLQKQLPTGQIFELAHHQKELLQKFIDNDGRVLAAHYMGTGKTVSAIVAAKMMLARPYRDTPPPDLKGVDLEAWMEEHPWDLTRKHPDNPKRICIVAPLNTVEQWRVAADDFDDGALVVGSGSNDIPIDDFVAGIKSGLYRPDMVVIGPEYWTIHADKLRTCGFDGIVIDEVHQGVKNQNAERNRKVKEWNSDMKMMMLLTGTPMTTSPTDFVEYIRLLSNGKEWADMTSEKFTAEYLEPSPIPKELGLSGKAGPKLQVKAHKRGELAAILSRYMHIARGADVRGKILPGVRVEENKSAHMTGLHAQRYNLFMATAGMKGAAGLTPEEASRLADPEARRASAAAKAIAQNIGYKPGSTEDYIRHTQISYTKEGKESEKSVDFRTFDPAWLTSEKARGKVNVNKWPSVQEVGFEGANIYDLYCREVLGMPYAELAGKPIGYGIAVKGVKDPYKLPVSKKQREAALKRMSDAGWDGGAKIRNPDAGPLGVRFQGTSKPWNVDLSDKIEAAKSRGDHATAAILELERQKTSERIEVALAVQRAFRKEIKHNPPSGGQTVQHWQEASSENALHNVASEFGIGLQEAKDLLNVNPAPYVSSPTFTTSDTGGYGEVSLKTNVDGDYEKGDWWVSDKAGSLHLPYRPEDWSVPDNAPLAKNGTFADVKNGEIVSVSTAGLKAAGVTKPKMPRGMSKDQRHEWKKAMEDWAPPPLRYDASIEEKDGKVGLIRGDNSRVVYVDKTTIKPQVKSLMDPGMRIDRVKWDLSMTTGNAAADQLQLHIERFHADGGKAGPDGERQMVLFGNGILESCRTMEAKMRLMGFRDVNEVIEGSPHFDPSDPTTKDGIGPNQKYFVTYIGSTYTGSRELNVSIFQKVKDKLGRDSKQSLFVHKVLEGRPPQSFIVDRVKNEDGTESSKKLKIPWAVYPGDFSDDHLPTGLSSIQMSQWTPDQRDCIDHQFKIKAPESYVNLDNGNGTETKAYFYGTKRSAAILRSIALLGNPAKMASEDAAKAIKQIATLKAEYAKIAAANATTDEPISAKQQHVFNNCEVMICSDAAQVGMNLGNASEMYMYDSLASPMAEAQRITRCARMLPPAVSAALLGEPVMVPKMTYQRDDDGNLVMLTNPDDPDGPKIAKKIEKKQRNPDTGKLETVMTQKVDDKGRPVYDGSGPFTAIREMEKELFDPESRELPSGVVEGLVIDGEVLGGADSEPAEAQSFKAALTTIAHHASTNADSYGLCDRMLTKAERQVRDEWEAISNKCAVAGNLGPIAARQMLLDLKKIKVPGGTENLISFPETGLEVVDAEGGTYDSVVVNQAEKRVREAIDKLPEADRQAILNSGFIQTEGPQANSHDAASIYMAIRAQEILTWVEDNLEEVGAEMRQSVGGTVVTDTDVMNRVIDRLSPKDRAILKTKKYLVNVRKTASSAEVGQIHMHDIWVAAGGELPDGTIATKKTKVRERVFTGYEREHPISTEQKKRAMSRARNIGYERILSDVQNGVDFRAEGAFEQVSSMQFAAASTLPEELAKALKLVFDVQKLRSMAWN